MLPLALALCSTLQAAPPPTPPVKPSVKEGKVAVEAAFLLIPRLPKGMMDARKGYAPVRGQLKVDLDYLQHTLRDLYRLQPSGAEIKAGAMRVPKEEGDQAKALLSMIQDQSFSGIEREVIAQRKAWEKDMQPEDSAKSNPEATPGPKKGAGPESPEAKEARSALDRLTQQIAKSRAAVIGGYSSDGRFISEDGLHLMENVDYWGPLPLLIVPLGRGGRVIKLPPPSSPYRTSITEFARMENHDDSARMATGQLTKIHLEDLSVAFDKLRLNLDEAFLKASDLIGDPAKTKVSESTQSLQRSLKILLMERLRSCLFFSWEIWADVASEKLPAPLARLAPPEPPAATSGAGK